MPHPITPQEIKRNATTEANRGLVYFHAATYRGRRGWVDGDDFVQEGMLGLLRAVEKLDPAKGKLGHYAGLWIRDRTARAALAARGPLRVPIRERGESVPSSGSQVLPYVAAREDGGSDDREALDELWAVVDDLGEPYRMVIRLRYGEGLFHREIGDRLGYTRQRIQQIEACAVARLREMLGGEERRCT